MKVYRGMRSEYQDDFSRDYSKSSYLNCFSFWAPSREYAEGFGSNIIERTVNPAKFFDLDDEDDVIKYENYFNDDIAPAEQNLNFALFLALNDYDGYTRIDSDDGTITDESDREYVILNKKDKELLKNQHRLVDDSFSTEEASKDYIFKLMKIAALHYRDNVDTYFVPEVIVDHWGELDIDGLLEIDINYAGKRAIRLINKDSILELAEKLRRVSDMENKLIKEFFKSCHRQHSFLFKQLDILEE